jgi:hypothetical protein
MKIRTGFVSNSSSSSFVCWGVPIEKFKMTDKMYLELFGAIEGNNNKDFQSDQEKINYMKKTGYNFNNYLWECIYKNIGLLNHGGQEYSKYIGLTPNTIEYNYPNLTFGEIRKFVIDLINQTFETNFTIEDIEYTEQGWYNG